MSNPDQEKAIATIAALAHSMAGTTLTDVQLDLLLIAENLMTNIAVQGQMALAKKAIEVEVPEFEIGEPCQIDDLLISGSQRATVTNKVQHLRGYDYQTSATGQTWIQPDMLHKVKK